MMRQGGACWKRQSEGMVYEIIVCMVVWNVFCDMLVYVEECADADFMVPGLRRV